MDQGEPLNQKLGDGSRVQGEQSFSRTHRSGRISSASGLGMGKGWNSERESPSIRMRGRKVEISGACKGGPFNMKLNTYHLCNSHRPWAPNILTLGWSQSSSSGRNTARQVELKSKNTLNQKCTIWERNTPQWPRREAVRQEQWWAFGTSQGPFWGALLISWLAPRFFSPVHASLLPRPFKLLF